MNEDYKEVNKIERARNKAFAKKQKEGIKYVPLNVEFKNNVKLWDEYLNDPDKFYTKRSMPRSVTDKAIDAWNLKNKNSPHKMVIPSEPYQYDDPKRMMRQRYRGDSQNHIKHNGRDIGLFRGGKKWGTNRNENAALKKELTTFMLNYKTADGQQFRVIEESRRKHLHIDTVQVENPYNRFIEAQAGGYVGAGTLWEKGREKKIFGKRDKYVQDLIESTDEFKEWKKTPNYQRALEKRLKTSGGKQEKAENRIKDQLPMIEKLLEHGVGQEYFHGSSRNKKHGEHVNSNLIDGIESAIVDKDSREVNSSVLRDVADKLKKEREKDMAKERPIDLDPFVAW